MKHVAAFAAGFGLALLFGLGFRTRRARELASRGRALRERFTHPAVDINNSAREQLLALGLGPDTADRIIEGRPYRNKLELVSRIMLPTAVYSSIKHRVMVSGTRDAVKVAS